MVLAENLFENLYIFYSFKVLSVSNISITKEENVPSLYLIISCNLQRFKYLEKKLNFSIKDIFSKCVEIWSHLLKKSLMEILIFCAVLVIQITSEN